MFEYIKGDITEITPTYIVLENSNIGYYIEISVNTFSQIEEKSRVTLYLHQVIREDAHKFYGFINKKEREIFRSLISVSGIGANTARMMLSSLVPNEIENAILSGDVDLLKSIKGVGAKTAQRVIVDLRDKVGKIDESTNIFVEQDNTLKKEALSALVMLGFAKNTVTKALDKLLKKTDYQNVEDIVKDALKSL